MDYMTFMALHAACIAAMRTYFLEAEKTSVMLAACAPDPLPFLVRMNLIEQEIVEKDAHDFYLGMKRLLHDAARLGYGSCN
jgi:hypothetical protein